MLGVIVVAAAAAARTSNKTLTTVDTRRMSRTMYRTPQ